MTPKHSKVMSSEDHWSYDFIEPFGNLLEHSSYTNDYFATPISSLILFGLPILCVWSCFSMLSSQEKCMTKEDEDVIKTKQLLNIWPSGENIFQALKNHFRLNENIF